MPRVRYLRSAVTPPRPDAAADARRYPDFFIVGAPKSATTSLHTFLLTLPDVSMRDWKDQMYFGTDFDDIRRRLWSDLGYSREERRTNTLRLGFIAQMLARNGVNVIVAAIAPFAEDRAAVRATVERFVEVHLDCPLDVLMQRDTSGRYARAMRGEIADFTGVSSPYERPASPEVHIRTDREPVEATLERLATYLIATGALAPRTGEARTALEAE